MKKISFPVFLAILWSGCLFFSSSSFAAEIHFKNQDRLSGDILEETDEKIVLETQSMGTLTIKKESIEKIVISQALVPAGKESPKAFEKAEKEKIWKKEFSFGYSMAHGNTEKLRTSGRLFLDRKTIHNEFILKVDSLYSSTDKKMDTQRFNGMLHYAFNFTPSLRWYNFYRVEGDHDRFANIDSRTTPFTGIGYWALFQERTKLLIELGAGFEYTNYSDSRESSQRNILTPRLFLEKGLWGKSKVTQDIAFFVSPEDTEDYRVHAEAAFTAPLDVYWSLRMSLIDDFNNIPGGAAKKNDIRLISSLVYSF